MPIEFKPWIPQTKPCSGCGQFAGVKVDYSVTNIHLYDRDGRCLATIGPELPGKRVRYHCLVCNWLLGTGE